MTIEECYKNLQGDYQGVIQRLGKEDRVKRFLLKFPEDNNFQFLTEAFGNKMTEDAYRAAHSIKGMAMNLGLTALQTSANTLCIFLRENGITDQAVPLFEQLKRDYESIVTEIQKFARA